MCKPMELLTIADWRAAQLAGGGLARLVALVEREARDFPVAWISLATPQQLEQQWAALLDRHGAHGHNGDKGDEGDNSDNSDISGESKTAVAELPLWGVPFAVKDNIDAAGFVTTAACPSFAGPPAEQDAPVVAALKAAGAILVGKTNLDQFATGLVGTRSPYGAVPNAFDPTRISGGSSSGSAVVVARGVVPFALGTDTAGSGRVPAGLNNIIGLKPTRGALSARGVVPACRTLDCVSILTLTLSDAEAVLRAAEIFDADDVYARTRPVNVFPAVDTTKKIAICSSPPWFNSSGQTLPTEQEAAYETALDKARRLGWRLEHRDFQSLFTLAQFLYEGPWVAERYEALRDFIQTAGPDDMDPVVRGIVLKAEAFSAADAFSYEYRRRKLTREINAAFADFDVLLVPTAPTFPTLADLVREPVKENSQLGTYTNFVNFMDWSALSVPAGFRKDGLPFGITLIGRRWHEAPLLQLASQWLGGEPRRLGATNIQRSERPLLSLCHPPSPSHLSSTPPPQSPKEPTWNVVVVGAHLSGLPLNKDLLVRGASLKKATKTAPQYRLFALPVAQGSGGVAKPGLKRVTGTKDLGARIEVEVWALPTTQVASFLSTIPHPLGIGSVELDDGSWEAGFICEPSGLVGALDVTGFGGWRAYIAHKFLAAKPTFANSIVGQSQLKTRPIRKVLIANRGEIAVRIIRTLHAMGMEVVVIYSQADADAPHTRSADVALALGAGSVADTYLNSDRIVGLATSVGVDAVIPGYGFLAENADFAAAVEAAGMAWIGPTPEQMRQLGLKHVARAVATVAGVPVVPGSDELIATLDAAKATALAIGYPVMIKSTAGGGGIGLHRCDDEEALAEAFERVQRLAKANFDDGGVFLEHYVSQARHIEVQIVGDGAGRVLAAGDRDCSLQRRHQKVVEEAPAPALPAHVREQMRSAAIALASSVCYRNVGTVEFIYEPSTESFYFLEVNTRLQVEHPVTESVTGIDLVECMVRVANGESDAVFCQAESSSGSDVSLAVKGASVEVRVYAESPLQQFRPCSGRILDLCLPSIVRVETWIERGTVISSLYDPLLAKLIATGANRESAVHQLIAALAEMRVVGVETNLEYLREVVSTPWFLSGNFSTNTLDAFVFRPAAVEVLDAGPATTVQDLPGRTGLWHSGIPPSGPMDDYSFRLANLAVGNKPDAPALEAAMQGPTLRFHTDAVVAVTGAVGDLRLNGNAAEAVPANQGFAVSAGDILSIGLARTGYRFYVAIRGGIDVPSVLSSRSTFELGKFGGHNGRKLQAGDILPLGDFAASSSKPYAPFRAVPAVPIPAGPVSKWRVGVVPGPHGAPDFFTEDGFASLFQETWTIHYNANRLGVRLVGPRPNWARETGDKAGLHPSNIHDAPYSIGSISFTGDEAVVLTCDGPSLGGFVSFCVIADAELWKIGQAKPGDALQLVPITAAEAVRAHQEMDRSIAKLEVFEPSWMTVGDDDGEGRTTTAIAATAATAAAAATADAAQPARAIIGSIERAGQQRIFVRQAGSHAILLEFGEEKDFSMRQSLRIFALIQAHKKSPIPGVVELTPGVRTVHVYYSQDILPETILATLSAYHFNVASQVASRRIRLPIAFDDSACRRAVARYGATIRSEAPWLPDNAEFLRQLNGLEPGGVQAMMSNAEFLVLGLGDVFLGSPCAVPLDPRHRLFGTKYNPSRSFTPRGAVGIGGQYLCIYGAESPGGYQLVGRTLGVSIWDERKLVFAYGPSLPPSPAGTGSRGGAKKPWKLQLFDRISFYPVTEAELDASEASMAGSGDGATTNEMIKVEDDAVLDLDTYEAWLAEIQTEVDAARACRREAIANAPFLDVLLKPPPQKVTNVLGNGASAAGRKDNDGAAGDGRQPGWERLAVGERVRAVVPGRCFKLSAHEGEFVNEGDTLLWIESNKMEIKVGSPLAGTVVAITIGAGDHVMPDDVLAIIAP